MNEQEGYAVAVQRLAGCNYEVVPVEQGYIVRHQTDTQDASSARHLADLLDLADLFEWAK